MAVTKRTRYEVLRRDNYTCRYCRSQDESLTVDHVVPSALGGTDAPSNLVACCRDCNAGKSSSSPDAPLVASVEADAVKWAAARKLAAAKLETQANRWRNEVTAFAQNWARWDENADHLPADWSQSVNSWLDQGLTSKQLIEATSIAVSKRHVQSDDVFRYVAGIARNKLIELDEATKAILTGQVG